MIKVPSSLKVSSINKERASLLFLLGYGAPFIITGVKVNFLERLEEKTGCLKVAWTLTTTF